MNERIIRRSYFCQARVYPQFLTGVSLSEKQNKKMMLEVDTQVIQTVLRMLNVY